MGTEFSAMFYLTSGLISGISPLPYETPPAAHDSRFDLLDTANFVSVKGHRGISKCTQSCSLIAKPAEEQSQRDDINLRKMNLLECALQARDSG